MGDEGGVATQGDDCAGGGEGGFSRLAQGCKRLSGHGYVGEC